jgi:hypothetical protein
VCDPQPEPEGTGPGAPDLEAILAASQGIGPDTPGAISAMTTVHSMWRRAWAETGAFSDEESFELVRILVAASAGGLRALG